MQIYDKYTQKYVFLSIKKGRSTLNKVGQMSLVLDYAWKIFIKLHFTVGFSNKEMLILAQNHHIIRSIHTLKRHSHKLFRRKHLTDLEEVIDFIYQELQRNGRTQGYH